MQEFTELLNYKAEINEKGELIFGFTLRHHTAHTIRTITVPAARIPYDRIEALSEIGIPDDTPLMHSIRIPRKSQKDIYMTDSTGDRVTLKSVHDDNISVNDFCYWVKDESVPEELTIDEIEKKPGYKVKIITREK